MAVDAADLAKRGKLEIRGSSVVFRGNFSTDDTNYDTRTEMFVGRFGGAKRRPR